MAQLREIYFRDQNDPKYRADQVEVTDDLEATIQQIMMTIFTKKGEVLGEPNFGLNLDILVLLIDIPEIKEKIAAFYD